MEARAATAERVRTRLRAAVKTKEKRTGILLIQNIQTLNGVLRHNIDVIICHKTRNY